MRQLIKGVEIKNGIPTIDGCKLEKYRTKSGCRKFFLYEDYIIKMDDPLNDFYQSSKEILFWDTIVEPKDKKFFLTPIGGCPRKACGRGYTLGWIAQRYTEFSFIEWSYGSITKEKEAKYLGICDYLEDKYGLTDLRGNWGLTQTGQFKILDWGLYDNSEKLLLNSEN